MRAVPLLAVLLSLPARAAPPPPPPKVVVTLVIDQLAAWVAAERWPLLPTDGGFARLRREGTWVRALVYEHAVTDTAPGHAALYTGAAPRESGIFANEIIDPATREKISILRDEQTRLIASDGPRDLPAASLRGLRVETLADRLRAEHPDSPIVSISLKDRAALFGGGRAPTATLWFDPSVGRFVTSNAFGHPFPPWAQPVVGPELLRNQRERVWEVSDPAFAAHAATLDEQAGESDLPGWGVKFPHRLDTAHDPARAFRASPFADEVLLTLGLAAVDANRGATPMLLAISLSSNDYIGHLFGPDSVEAWDELRRLDAQLGRFFAALDEKLGPDGWAVLLTGDHGTTTLPEAVSPKTRPWCKSRRPDPWERACGAAHRVVPDELLPKLEAAATRVVPTGGPWVSGIADPYVYLTAAARALPGQQGDQLRRAIVDALAAEPAVLRVVDAHQVAPRCAARDSLDALLCRSLVSGAPGDYYVMLKPGSFFDPDYVIGFGTSHGSPYLYDRSVPLLVRAPGRVAAGKVLQREPVGTFTRTASGLLGIPPPPTARNGTDLAH